MTTKFEIDDTWARAEGETDGRPVIIRVRSHLRPLAGHPLFPNRLTITWNWDVDPRQANAGLPSDMQQDAMTEFEDALIAELEPARVAVLTSVWTTAGEREWVWYCGDGTALEARINEALVQHEPYPIRLTLEADPSWRHYLDVLSKLEL